MKSRSCNLVVGALAVLLLLAPPALSFENEARIGPMEVRHGHGELVRLAIADTPFAGDYIPLFRAQWELDFPDSHPADPDGVPRLGLHDVWNGLVAGFDADQMRMHFLRWWSGLPEWRTQTHPLRQDWQEAVDYLEGEVRSAYLAPTRSETLRHLGHALHTLQDSYSPAHTERNDRDQIVAMRYYPSRDPGGHRFLGDPGDRILDEQGALRPLAARAIAASRDLLLGFAALPPHAPDRLEAFLRGFEARHLTLSKELP